MHYQQCARACARRGAGRMMGHCNGGAGGGAGACRHGACGNGGSNRSAGGQRCFGGGGWWKNGNAENKGQGKCNSLSQEQWIKERPAEAGVCDGTGKGRQRWAASTNQQSSANVEPTASGGSK